MTSRRARNKRSLGWESVKCIGQVTCDEWWDKGPLLSHPKEVGKKKGKVHQGVLVGSFLQFHGMETWRLHLLIFSE